MSETVSSLFTLAIEAENNMRTFYLGLAERFPDVDDVAEFFSSMADDEQDHARRLQEIRRSLPEDRLGGPADPAYLEQARKVSAASIAAKLNSVNNLDEAYIWAHDLEYAEVNAVFCFIAQEFFPSEQRGQIALGLINQHQNKLLAFFRQLGDSHQRKGILVHLNKNPR